MATKKGNAKGGDDTRVRSGRSGSAGRKGKEAPSAFGGSDGKRQKINIWPEWSDSDVNAEKWETVHKAKEKEKGKSPSQTYFDDPDGKVWMPPSFKVVQWKRPPDVILEKTPVIVDPEHMFGFDLITNNEHLFYSETMRWIITQIDCMWSMNATKATGNEPADVAVSPEGRIYNWRPWEHIYAINKIGKGPNMPQYNPSGKYIVKLYWMGCWRKIIIDDSIPFDEQDRPLLPFTTHEQELWPLLLTKGLLKIASLDYGGGCEVTEFGDFSVIHCFTGWLPQTVMIRKEQSQAIWKLLNQFLPEWKLPEPDKEKTGDEDGNATGMPEGGDKSDAKEATTVSKDAKGKKDEKGKGKDHPAAKDAKKDKKEKNAPEETNTVPEKPQAVIFASYHDVTRKHPYPVQSLTEMADQSERLRRVGLSHLLSHPVVLSQFRSCPLAHPLPPEVIPAWKLIRPRVKKSIPKSDLISFSAEEAPKEVEKPLQCIELQSAFVQFKVSDIPIPTSTSRPVSALQRGGAHPGAPLQPTISEDPPQQVDKPLISNSNLETPVPLSSLGLPVGSAEPPGDGRKISIAPNPRPISSQVKPNANKDNKDESMESKPPGVMSRHMSVSGKQSKDILPGTGKHTGTGKKTADETVTEEMMHEKESVDISITRKMWMDLDKFCECFQALHIYHKVSSYQHVKIASDAKNMGAQTTASSPHKDNRKSAASYPPGNALDERVPQYLYVDSVNPTEIIFCLAALCRWNEPPNTIATLPPATITASSQQNTQAPLITNSFMNGSFVREGEQTPIRAPDLQSASVISEWHYWKKIRIGEQFKRMTTTGVKAVSLRLPPGRHCLKFYVRAPLGYHLTLLSAQPFVYGDEDVILPHTKQLPVRLSEYGQNLINQLIRLIDVYSDVEKRPAVEMEYVKLHCPFINMQRAELTKRTHFQNYREALYQTLKKALGDKITADYSFAWRVFNGDTTSVNPLGVQYATQAPTTFTNAAAPRGASRNTKTDTKKQAGPTSSTANMAKEDVDTKPDLDAFHGWANREATMSELSAITLIQKSFRGYLHRKILQAQDPATPEHKRVMEYLLKCKAFLEPNAEQLGLQLLNTLFQLQPQCLHYFSFATDFENYCTYQDYQGNYFDQQPNSWFLVFREIFHVRSATANMPPPSNIFAFPKIITQPHIPSCYVRIINNDTGEELERTLGERNTPRDFQRNHKGYSFVAVAKTGDQPLSGGKWKLRVIGHGGQPSLQPVHPELTSNFVHQELIDYYVPNKDNIVMRQLLSVSGEDHLATLLFRVSKPDVPLTLQIMDYEEVLLTSTGIGQVIIPAVLLQKEFGNPIGSDGGDENALRSSSRQSVRGGPAGGAGRKKGSAKSTRLSPHGSVGSGLDGMGDTENGIRLHKYSVVATLKPNTWPLNKVNWELVETLKQQEVEEMKLNGKPREVSPPRLSNAVEPKKDGPGAAAKGAKATGKVGSGQAVTGKDAGKASATGAKGGAAVNATAGKKEDPAASRPDSVSMDLTKAHWILRVFSDGQTVEDLTIKRDTERAEEIRAMKKAWEELEPGRAERARQSRLRYLNSRMIQNPDYVPPSQMRKTSIIDDSTSTLSTSASPAAVGLPPIATGDEEDEEQLLTLTPPSSEKVPELILPPLDLSPYQRGDPHKARYLDYETRMQEEMQWKQKELQRYRDLMEEWETWCAREKTDRNLAKIKQLEIAKKLQALVDRYRERYFRDRETFRVAKLEEAFRKQQEEQAALEAAAAAEAAAKGGKGRNRSPGSAKGKKSPSATKKK